MTMRFLVLATAFIFSSSAITVAHAAVKKAKRYYMTEVITLPNGKKKKVKVPVQKVNGKFYRIGQQPKPKALPASNSTTSITEITPQATKKKKRKNNQRRKKRYQTTAQLPVTNTVSAPQTVATKPEKKSSWGISYLNLASIDQKEIEEGTGALDTYNRLTFANSFGTAYSFQIRPQFFINYDIEQGSTKHTIGDLRLEAKKGEVFNLGALKSGGGLRFDLPTGEGSRGASSNGFAQVQLTPSATLSANISYGGWWAARYHLQGERAPFKGFDGDGALIASSGNRQFRAFSENWVGFKLSEIFTFEPLLGLDFGTYYSEPALNVESNTTLDIYAELPIVISVTDSLSLTLKVAQAHRFVNSTGETEGFSLFNQDELTYSLVTSATFL